MQRFLTVLPVFSFGLIAFLILVIIQLQNELSIQRQINIQLVNDAPKNVIDTAIWLIEGKRRIDKDIETREKGKQHGPKD